MPATLTIPGRRISFAETFYTDWIGRGGDCVLLRIEVLLVQQVGSEAVRFDVETRGEDGTSVTTVTATSPSGGLEVTGTGVATCIYLATTSTTAGNGAQEHVRVKVSMTGTAGNGAYYVVRIFPIVFFDSARSY